MVLAQSVTIRRLLNPGQPLFELLHSGRQSRRSAAAAPHQHLQDSVEVIVFIFLYLEDMMVFNHDCILFAHLMTALSILQYLYNDNEV